MIRTVTVYTGESRFARAAQQHAIEIAKQFKARLKVVDLWSAEEGGPVVQASVPAEALGKGNQNDIVNTAEQAGLHVDTAGRGRGMTRGLLEEAKETDLLVLGLPTETERDENDTASRLFKNERPVMNRAECALLIVNEPPSPLEKILVKHEAGIAGKAMLRMAGAVAERYSARVGILTMENDIARSTELAAAAQEYLKGFDIPAIETLPKSGPPDSKVEILRAAESFGADLIAMGEEGHNWLERWFGADLAERTALTTSTPFLIVR